MRELRERYPRPDAQLAPSSAGPRHARHAGHKLTPCSLARITVRRATSHADSKAAATDGHRNLAAALRDNARDATQVLPFSGHHKPVNQTVRHFAEALTLQPSWWPMPVNVAALRRHARDPRRPLATLGISLGRTDITTERRSPGSQGGGGVLPGALRVVGGSATG
jgi:hypothetical protein